MSSKGEVAIPKNYVYFGLVAIVIVAIGIVAILSGSNSLEPDWPQYVQNASAREKQAYQFAVDHPEALEYQPCYCGCGNMAIEHKNNLDCFIQDVDEDGNITFDNHAAGCGICVDIALDVQRLTEEGKSQTEIRNYVDARYGSSGPSTDTEMPPEDEG